jgi:hypothetical protein
MLIHEKNFSIKDNSLDDAAIWQKICEGGANMGVLDIADLNDVNIIREKISFPPKDEISEDMLMQTNPLKGTNVNKTKQEVGKPYANPHLIFQVDWSSYQDTHTSLLTPF